MRTLAVGDIHGCSAALDALLAVVQPTPDDLVVFLGDYVDRGPDSKGVIDRLIGLRQTHRVVCLRGNHEVMMTDARRDRGELKNWLAVGGVQTMNSYIQAGWRASFDDVPAEHWEFLEDGLFDYFETDTHIFVHANLEPSTSLDEQPDMYLFWEFVNQPVRHQSGKIMVCGHSSQKTGLPKAWPTTYLLDTGAYAGGWLTCLDVGSQKYWQANAAGQVRTADLNIEE
jgi:serine/threonine protein phosphatase 1